MSKKESKFFSDAFLATGILLMFLVIVFELIL